LMIGGEVHLAEPGLGGFVLRSSPGDPALVRPTDAWARDGVDHPVLWLAAGVPELWFTGFANGRGTVATASWDGAHFVSDGPVAGLQATATRGFACAIPTGASDIVVRVDDDDRGQTIEIFSTSSGTPTPYGVVRANRQADVFSFDRDEIGALGTVVLRGATRVYYAGRRGTRWTIGVLASSDGSNWNAPPGGPVLAGSDRGFDALGVQDPGVDVVDGVVHLYYSGNDGMRTRIGVAVGATP